MRLMMAALFFSSLALMGCSQDDSETEELEKIVYLEEEMGATME